LKAAWAAASGHLPLRRLKTSRAADRLPRRWLKAAWAAAGGHLPLRRLKTSRAADDLPRRWLKAAPAAVDVDDIAGEAGVGTGDEAAVTCLGSLDPAVAAEGTVGAETGAGAGGEVRLGRRELLLCSLTLCRGVASTVLLVLSSLNLGIDFCVLLLLLLLSLRLSSARRGGDAVICHTDFHAADGLGTDTESRLTLGLLLLMLLSSLTWGIASSVFKLLLTSPTRRIACLVLLLLLSLTLGVGVVLVLTVLTSNNIATSTSRTGGHIEPRGSVFAGSSGWIEPGHVSALLR